MSSQKEKITERMTPLEMRASASLASIYGLRMLGMFLILPIFAIYAAELPGGDSQLLVGLALGAYGLTQAVLQLPFGMASDRFGRKRVIYFGLLIFVIGSLVAALAMNIYGIILGRALQGAGAISAAVMALVADSTREEHRTKAMAMIGSTIGLTFALSLILGPILNRWIGVPGIFALTGVLAALAILVVKYVVPDPRDSHFHSDTQAASAKLKDVLNNRQLLRLNFGIFALHATQMAMFLVVPFAIRASSGMDVNQHWLIYLPVLLLSFVVMVPVIIVGETKARLKQIFVTAIALMLGAQLLFAFSIAHFWGIVISLGIYFIAFNILEATLPSIISKIAPAAFKGTAMGVYNTAQSLGIFTGGLVGGYLSHYHGDVAVFAFCSVLMALWLFFAISMQAPPAVRTKMYHLEKISAANAKILSEKLSRLAGVRETTVIAEEGLVVLKVDMKQEWDEQLVLDLIATS